MCMFGELLILRGIRIEVALEDGMRWLAMHAKGRNETPRRSEGGAVKITMLMDKAWMGTCSQSSSWILAWTYVVFILDSYCSCAPLSRRLILAKRRHHGSRSTPQCKDTPSE